MNILDIHVFNRTDMFSVGHKYFQQDKNVFDNNVFDAIQMFPAGHYFCDIDVFGRLGVLQQATNVFCKLQIRF